MTPNSKASLQLHNRHAAVGYLRVLDRMQRWVVMVGTSVQPTNPLGIVLVIALVEPVVRVQADHTALALHHQGRFPATFSAR